MKSYKYNKGFTLIEIIVTLLILGVLASSAIPTYLGYVDKAKATIDLQSLSLLNRITKCYTIQDPDPNPFEITTTTDKQLTDKQLMQVLSDSGLLDEEPVLKQDDVSFVWSFTNQLWSIETYSGTTSHEVIASEVTLGTGGAKDRIISYSGTATDILIPKTFNGITITNIYQDAFAGKSLTSVSFASDSSITQLHARSFQNNSLTLITLPSSLTRIDYGAFKGNNITTVTIGANVALESYIFGTNTSDFNTVYSSNGAGTYIYTDKKWVKQ